MTSSVVLSCSINPDIPKSLEVQGPRSLDGKIIWKSALSEEMARTPHPTDNSEVARRLSVLRQAVAGENQTAFALRLGIEIKRWNNFERGFALSKEIAFLLVQKIPGVTLDWLWLGNESGLPLKLQMELAEAEKLILARAEAQPGPLTETPSRVP